MRTRGGNDQKLVETFNIVQQVEESTVFLKYISLTFKGNTCHPRLYLRRRRRGCRGRDGCSSAQFAFGSDSQCSSKRDGIRRSEFRTVCYGKDETHRNWVGVRTADERGYLRTKSTKFLTILSGDGYRSNRLVASNPGSTSCHKCTPQRPRVCEEQFREGERSNLHHADCVHMCDVQRCRNSKNSV